MDEKLWEECVKFHGHGCPGLAIGYAASFAAMERLGIPMERAVDEEIVCVSENDACGIDCIQYLLSCTAGKGNLLFRRTGKSAYSFFSRKSGKGIRLVVEFPAGWEDLERGELMRKILESPAESLFVFKKPGFELPEKARIFESVRCEVCGERTREDMVRLQEGRKVCLSCFKPYDRGWI
ncbi:MAG: formylmethanofuran dehydrogenase [Thermoplasmatales archaeon]|nr:formylmethanofuran dehydrogenase [Thermoplasmatales archaeon]